MVMYTTSNEPLHSSTQSSSNETEQDDELKAMPNDNGASPYWCKYSAEEIKRVKF